MHNNNNDRIDDLISEDDDPVSREHWQRVRDCWTFLLSSRKGRVVVRDLLTLTRFGKTAFAHDTNVTMVNAGLQMVGEYIIDMLTECYPEAYGLMLKEAKEDEEHDRQSRNPERSSPSRGSDNRSGWYTG